MDDFGAGFTRRRGRVPGSSGCSFARFAAADKPTTIYHADYATHTNPSNDKAQLPKL